MKKRLLKEFGLALFFSGLVVLVILFGSKGPQFIYALF